MHHEVRLVGPDPGTAYDKMDRYPCPRFNCPILGTNAVSKARQPSSTVCFASRSAVSSPQEYFSASLVRLKERDYDTFVDLASIDPQSLG